MKKSRLISLLLLYAAILISIICLQTYAFGNLEMRSFVNWCSIIIGAAGGVIFWLLLRHNGTALPKEKEKKVQKIAVTKEQYVTAMTSYHLTTRELELGFLILSGYSNPRIAQELFISEATVKKHITHIYEKTNVQNRVEFKNLFS